MTSYNNPTNPQQLTREFEQELTDALRAARFEGWERGRKQLDTPYDYTLGDEETYIKGLFKRLTKSLTTSAIELCVAELLDLLKFRSGESATPDTVVRHIDQRIKELQALREGE